MSPAAGPEDSGEFGPERLRGLAMALAAYNLLMDEAVTESQHCRRVEDHERIAYLGNIVERAAARQRERERADS